MLQDPTPCQFRAELQGLTPCNSGFHTHVVVEADDLTEDAERHPQQHVSEQDPPGAFTCNTRGEHVNEKTNKTHLVVFT